MAVSYKVAASMRPRSFERGNTTEVERQGKVQSASMRPRSFERGNGVARERKP